jgi:hypothetical protein
VPWLESGVIGWPKSVSVSKDAVLPSPSTETNTMNVSATRLFIFTIIVIKNTLDEKLDLDLKRSKMFMFVGAMVVVQ